MLCGNGTLGAIVMGQPLDERAIFSHEKLFLPLEVKLPPVDTGSHLQEIRNMLQQGEFKRVAEFVVELSKAQGYEGPYWTDPFFPACELELRVEQAGEVQEYVHALDFATGLATVEWRDNRGAMRRQAFVSRADGIAVLQLSAVTGAKISCSLALQQVLPETTSDYWDGPEKYRTCLATPEMHVEDNWLYFRGQFQKAEGGYECAVRVIATGGAQRVEQAHLHVQDADGILVLVQIVPLEPGARPRLDKIKMELAHIPADFDLLLARHATLHAALYDRSAIRLGSDPENDVDVAASWQASRQGHPAPAYFQRLFDAGRYVILSSSGAWPPNLQGVWTGIYGVPWSSDYTLNGNVQTAIAGLLAGNLPECMDSYLRYMEHLREDARWNAQAMFNCRGILLPSRTSSHGLNNHFRVEYPMTLWTAGAGWAAHFFYDYWLHTCDNEFFLQRALPFMKEAALFYEDFMVEDESGCWCFTPSYSPENTPGNSDSAASTNATMDIAIAKELFGNLIEGCRTLGVEEENVVRWVAILAKMPPYLVNQGGAAKEWCDPRLEDQYDHRHASHLYPLMYGIARELADEPELLGAFAEAYRLRVAERKKEADIMAFGSIQLAQAAVHLRDIETVWHILQELASGYYYSNLATAHDRGPKIFNADLSGGMPGLIIECLIQSQQLQDEHHRITGYRIDILPALPPAWESGELKGALTRGGFEVDLAWEACQLKSLEIKNTHGKQCVVHYQGQAKTPEPGKRD